MKKIFQFLVIIFAGLLVGSCEDVVQVKLDEGSKLYVIDAFLSDLPGRQLIHITTNDSYFSNREAPPVGDAAVTLTDLTAGTTFSFNNAGNGDYVFMADDINHFAAAGHQFQLNVTVNGITYTSLTTQKRGASIDTIIAATPEQLGGFGGPSKDTVYFCVLLAKDKTDANTDYYWIKNFRNDSLIFGPSQINLSIDGTNGAVTQADRDSLEFTPPIIYLNFTSYRKGNSCEVQIHSLSRETYFFILQAQVQINNGGLFATTPENVKTNIVTPVNAKTKAVGWFNVATTARMKVVVP